MRISSEVTDRYRGPIPNLQAGRFLMFIGALCLLAACSPSAPNTSTTGSSPATGKNTTQAISGNACDAKLLGIEDAGGILSEAVIATKPLKGDTQTCYFITAHDDRGGPNLMVSVRPGLGKATIGSFTSGKMDQYAKWTSLPDLGDGAVWMADLGEVQVEKSDVLCDIRPSGTSKTFQDLPLDARQKRLGALCEKIFVALKLSASALTAPTANSNATSTGNLLETACEKNVLPADVADILTAPVVKRPGYNPQSCSYHAAAGATVTISLAKGDEGKFAWSITGDPASGRMDPLAGVGDSALQGRGGTVVIARKGDLVCSIDITGTDNADGMKVITPARNEDLAKKLGTLCGKVFAAR